MTVDEIRDRFLRFFEERGHRIYPSDSLVPSSNDPTLLFTGAGMNQFKEEFLGRVKGSRRVASCQKCLRTGDLEHVGKTPGHHTFFEMLGNFSFGDYFKKDAIIWAWEFLTKELGLKDRDLWVSVYKDDEEAYNIWKDIVKIPAKTILKLGEKENFWPSNAPSEGPNGPCGPCSEIFYKGRENDVEVWNLVFTQFDRKDGGVLEPLPNKNIDTGMGIERLARVMQGKNTNFEIDSFAPIIKTIEELAILEAGLKGMGQSKLNAIADHIRAVTFAIGDGVLPSNEERGYVVRKLIRKAFWYGRSLGIEKPFLYKIVPVVTKVMQKPYPELTSAREDIAQVVLSEEERFRTTIQEGLERLEDMIENSRSSGALSGDNIFKLYDTYGFPLELTEEIAQNENMAVDIKGFEDCMAEQRARSRESSKIEKSIFSSLYGNSKRSAEAKHESCLAKADNSVSLEEQLDLNKTNFIEDKETIETPILQIIVGNEVREHLAKNEKGSIFLKETNFYGEKGGQVGDTGWLIKDAQVVADVTKAIDVAGIVRHDVVMKDRLLSKGDMISVKIDIARRENIRRNHTATHLLQYALRKVLGQHVKQAGSLVAPDRLRFDFTHFRALTEDEVRRIEDLVNECIRKGDYLDIRVLPFKEAQKENAIALFGEKYADVVRMVSIGDYSKELCGGTHVLKTGELVLFKIISESSIASGTRRIEAITGEFAVKKVKENEDLIKQIANELDTTAENVSMEIEKVSIRLKKLEKALDAVSNEFLHANIGIVLDKVKKIKETDVIISEIKNIDMSILRKISDIIKVRLKKGLFVLISEKDGKLSLILGICGAYPFNAVEILNALGAQFGLKGGGRQDFAQAGGSSEQNISQILEHSEKVIRDTLESKL